MCTGATIQMALRPRTVADFYAEYRKALAALGVEAKIWPMPVEVAAPVRFDLDTEHKSYDPRRGGTVPPGADAGGCAAEAVFDGVPGEDQPGAFLLGQLRPGGDAVQRAAVRAGLRGRTGCSRRRTRTR